MSIVHCGPEFYVTCDVCEAELPAEFDFFDAVEAKKRAGWISRKNTYGEWEDVCPCCQRQSIIDDFDEEATP